MNILQKTKKQLNDVDKILLFITILFFGIGLLNIVTASSREAISQKVTLYHFFERQFLMILVGGVGATIILHIPTNAYKKLAPLLTAIIGIFMFYSLLTAKSVRGVDAWSEVAGARFQPSEFAKVAMIVTLACIFDAHYKKLRSSNRKKYDIIGLIFIFGLGIPVVVFLQKDLGTMLVQVITFGVMFLASPLLSRDKINTIGIGVIMVVLMGIAMYLGKGYILTELQVNRLYNYRKPCHHYEDGGYQVCNSIIAINSGGLFGLGIGKSKQKYSYIPEPHTDSVFPIIVEENGLVGVTIIFILYILLLMRILMVSANATTVRGRFIALGVGTYIISHIILNLGGIFASIPLTGLPLPFLSYGGSYTISLICALGLVQRVHIETKNRKIKINDVY